MCSGRGGAQLWTLHWSGCAAGHRPVLGVLLAVLWTEVCPCANWPSWTFGSSKTGLQRGVPATQQRALGCAWRGSCFRGRGFDCEEPPQRGYEKQERPSLEIAGENQGPLLTFRKLASPPRTQGSNGVFLPLGKHDLFDLTRYHLAEHDFDTQPRTSLGSKLPQWRLVDTSNVVDVTPGRASLRKAAHARSCQERCLSSMPPPPGTVPVLSQVHSIPHREQVPVSSQTTPRNGSLSSVKTPPRH